MRLEAGNRMETWQEAWPEGEKMPPHSFPRDLLLTALDLADAWCQDGRFRCLLEEWLPRQRAAVELVYLFYDGYRLRGEIKKRMRPIPILVQLLYTEPFPTNEVELEERIDELFALVMREWCRARERHGDDLEHLP